MPEIIRPYFPNLANYWSIFVDSLIATGQMFVYSGLITLVIGGLFGIGLAVTKEGGLRPNRFIHITLEAVTNIFRSVPFIILLIFLIPFTRAIAGTAMALVNGIRKIRRMINGTERKIFVTASSVM